MFIRFISHHSSAGENGARDQLTVECKQYAVTYLADGEIYFNMDSGEGGEYTLARPAAGPWSQAYVMNDQFQTVERYQGPQTELLDAH